LSAGKISVVVLPPLRRQLDVVPSPIPDRPGLLIRDPLQYSESILIIPDALVPFLAFFDGEKTTLDLKAALVRATGELGAGAFADTLHENLSGHGFLEDEPFEALRRGKELSFATAPVCRASHAGLAYPAEVKSLEETLDGYLAAGEDAHLPGTLVGIAAPHVSPEGGPGSYAAAYALLKPELADRTFVVLGTSHYGAPGRFGLTRKPFETPFGRTEVDPSLVDSLSEGAPGAVILEDYAFAVEHSIEFQVVFLQHILGPRVRILPVLCGPLFPHDGKLPEEDPGVSDFLEALRRLAAQEKERLFFVLGVDLCHMGRRYGDPFAASSGAGVMKEVEGRDRERIGRILEGDAEGFFRLLGAESDALKWCGTSPLYAFLRAVPGLEGRLLRYEQWNIDPSSVVGFGALAFSRRTPLPRS
jgi:AmmeMemoRadiSam system protein B